MRRRNARYAVALVTVAFAMGGLAFASAPLYRLFCAVTGLGGTPQRAVETPAAPYRSRVITVRFDANVHPDLPWSFAPGVREMVVNVGEPALAVYRARSRSASPSTGTATFNVTPGKAGPYFSKLDCFCFEAQTLAAGEEAELAVSFFVDPAIMADPNLDDLSTITLSYTFFRDDEAAPRATQASLDGGADARGVE